MPITKILDDATAYAMANQALPFWDFAQPQLDLISRSENIVFRVDTQASKQYVLRIHRPGYHTLDELNAEQEWTTALTESGLSVPVAVKTRIGQGYVPINVPGSDGIRYVGVVEWFEGTPLRQLSDEEIDSEMTAHYFHQLGQIAARIHNQSAGWVPSSSTRRHGLDADGLAGDSPFWGRFWDLPQIGSAEQTRLSNIRAAIHQRLMDMSTDPQQFSLIHADLHQGNLLIKDDVLHVIDFDDCGYSWHIYEFAVSLFYSMDDPNFSQLQDSMIAGYRTQRALSGETVALLPFFLLIRGLSLIGWIHERPELGRSERIPKLVANAIEQAETLGL